MVPMDLFCCERLRDGTLRAVVDPVLRDDIRVLRQLLLTEVSYTLTDNYFQDVQSQITPDMRRACLCWMMEVCEEEYAEHTVFPSAVNFLDRFLSRKSCQQVHLQLLGTVCLFLASKMRQTTPFTVNRLANYTDNTYDEPQILEWEHYVLHILDWDTSSIVANDYLDAILSKLRLGNKERLARKHAIVFLQVCLTEFQFALWPASHLALGCIGAAINGLIGARQREHTASKIANVFQGASSEVSVELVERCIVKVEILISIHCMHLQLMTPAERQAFSVSSDTDGDSSVPSYSSSGYSSDPSMASYSTCDPSVASSSSSAPSTASSSSSSFSSDPSSIPCSSSDTSIASCSSSDPSNASCSSFVCSSSANVPTLKTEQYSMDIAQLPETPTDLQDVIESEKSLLQ